MVAVEISDAVYELLERSIKQSESYDNVSDLVDSISKEFLMKRDLYGRMHAPIQIILKNTVDNLHAIRTLLQKIDWQDRSTPMNATAAHIESAEKLMKNEIEFRKLDQE